MVVQTSLKRDEERHVDGGICRPAGNGAPSIGLRLGTTTMTGPDVGGQNDVRESRPGGGENELGSSGTFAMIRVVC